MAHINLVIPVITRFDLLDYVKPFEKYGLTFSQSHIEHGPASIESEFDELFCGPATVIKAMEAEAQGADAVVICCMGDPALYETRQAVAIPVIGPGETAMHTASTLGHRFSILPTLERRIFTYESHARKYGLESRLASVRPLNVAVLEIDSRPDVFETILEKAELAVRADRADVIILGCLGLQGLDLRVKDALALKGLHVAVIDALPLAIMSAATLVRTGLRHSPRAFPLPPSKEISGYSIPPFSKRV